MEVTPAFWRHKKVSITGLTGFKGAWLGLILKSFGAKVQGLSLAPEEASLFSYLKLNSHFDSLVQDIREPSSLTQKFNAFNPEIVFHMAAQSLVRESYQSPVETFETNVQGTVNVMEAVRHNPSIKSLVVITTDKCYENKETGQAYVESDPLGGHDPYSASKAACEIAVASYQRSFYAQLNKGLASARAGNVIGGGDFAKDRIVPDAYRAFSKNQKLQIRYPKAVRPWQHVLEPLSGYILLAEKLSVDPIKYSQAWNFGPDSSLTLPVEKLVSDFAKKWGANAGYEVLSAEHLHEATLLSLNCQKAKDQLGWQPVLNFDQTLDLTVSWYQTFQKTPENATQTTLSQIQNYIKIRTSS